MTDPAVPATAPPNDLAPDQLRLRPDARGEIRVDPQRAGWRYLSFRVARLGGEPLTVGGPGTELALVTIAGGVRVEIAGGATIELPGRASVWAGLPWTLYLPAGLEARVMALSQESTLAVAGAPISGRTGPSAEPIVIGPENVRVEVRGAGSATRQINHLIGPDVPADRLLVVEVYTPSGNWSSWPPHKHDIDDMPREAVLEEVYWYTFRRPQAWGVQRLYRTHGSPAGPPRDALWAVRPGDLVLVTDGYHPFSATHGDDAYYLNVLAGDRRTMACSFDPALDFVREAWAGMEADPRVPLVR